MSLFSVSEVNSSSLVAALAVTWSYNTRQAVLEHFAWLRLGHTLRWSWQISQPPSWFQPALSALLYEKAFMCISWAESRLPSALLLVPPTLNRPRGLVFPLSEPRTGAPSMWLNFSLPGQISTCVISSSRLSLPWGWVLAQIISLPFLPVWIFLIALTVQDSFCLSSVSFQWELFNMQVYF